MQNFLEIERRNLNVMIRKSALAFLESKKNNKLKCDNCGNSSNFRIKLDKCQAVCKSCNSEILLDKKISLKNPKVLYAN